MADRIDIPAITPARLPAVGIGPARLCIVAGMLASQLPPEMLAQIAAIGVGDFACATTISPHPTHQWAGGRRRHAGSVTLCPAGVPGEGGWRRHKQCSRRAGANAVPHFCVMLGHAGTRGEGLGLIVALAGLGDAGCRLRGPECLNEEMVCLDVPLFGMWCRAMGRLFVFDVV